MTNIVLIVADDLGWGQVGYNGHPHLSTPEIDAIASNGLRMDRFYTNGPLCSPTRASILTGRAPDRTGMVSHGFRLRSQEKTITELLKDNGYKTGHFGKWHLSGLKGLVGAPVLTTDTHGPGAFGFDEWFSNVNNIAWAGQLGDHNGVITEITGDTSEAIADKANDFIDAHSNDSFFAAVWFSAPHDPFTASAADKAGFSGLSDDLQNHLGEIVAMDRAIGTIRQKLRDLNLEQDTVVWFCSDNGGLALDPDANGSFRGIKNEMYDGGIRVPCAVEWPGTIPGSVTNQLAWTADIAPTLAEIAGVVDYDLVAPQDGCSLLGVFERKELIHGRSLNFFSLGRSAVVREQWKAVAHYTGDLEVSFHNSLIPATETVRVDKISWELYDTEADPYETTDLATSRPEIIAAINNDFLCWYGGLLRSANGLDYDEGYTTEDPYSQFWLLDPIYAAYVTPWSTRPEYADTYTQAGL